MVRRALTRQTRWYQSRCSTFKIKDFIVQKSFWKILEFWPLVTSILTWAKKWPKWFRNDFSRAFERRFPFCSTMRKSRDRRGGGVFKHPPPPAGRGKSRGPAGRGLTCLWLSFELRMEGPENKKWNIYISGYMWTGGPLAKISGPNPISTINLGLF